MSKFLLDYVFPITTVSAIPAASTAFLKQAAIVCKPKAGQEANVGKAFECTTMTEVAILTANTNAQRMFDGGMSRVFILLASSLDLSTYMEGPTVKGKFFTLLASSDFADADIPEVLATKVFGALTYTSKKAGTSGNSISVGQVDGATPGVSVTGEAITVTIDDAATTNAQVKALIEAHAEAKELVSVSITTGQEATLAVVGALAVLTGGQNGFVAGSFEGVTGIASADEELLIAQGIIKDRCAFFSKDSNDGGNMMFAFAKLLSNITNWSNQQLIDMPLDDEIDELGEAVSLFDERVSFALQDDEFGKRLGFFVAGKRAIVAPYIFKNFKIDLQSRAVQWIATNQPDYTVKDATLLEAALIDDVATPYIEKGWLTEATIVIKADQGNFIASGQITAPNPKALWRVANQFTESN